LVYVGCYLDEKSGVEGGLVSPTATVEGVLLPLTRPRPEARLMGRYWSIGFSLPHIGYTHTHRTPLETPVVCPLIILLHEILLQTE
jgi:hypothetical protein